MEVWRTIRHGPRIWSHLQMVPWVDWCEHSWRLRVTVAGRSEYLSSVVAYAFSPHGAKSWRDFKRKGLEGDHLPCADLVERPGTAFAGWVAAVTRAEHVRRTKARRQARAALIAIEAVEAEAERYEEMQRLFRALSKKKGVKARSKLAKLKKSAPPQWRGDWKLCRAAAAAGRWMLSWDVDEWNVHGGGVDPDAFADCPGARSLFIDRGIEPREALKKLIDCGLGKTLCRHPA